MTTHITKTWFDGEKVVTQEIPESEVYKQEPVAWMVYTQNGVSVYVTDNPVDIQDGQRALPLYTTQQTAQEPVQALYYELLLAVSNKYPGETRHQTALRYIQQAESFGANQNNAAYCIKEKNGG